MGSTTRLRVLFILLVLASSFLAFLPALDGQWLNWDDETNFSTNPHYRGFGLAELRWMFSATLLAVYIPLSWLTLALNYVLGGMDPWGYHLGNLLFHTANAGLFFVVAQELLRSAFDEPVGGAPSPALITGAAFAGFVFAVHPLRAESVAWVTERRDVQSAFFYLLAVWTYLRGVRDGVLRGRWRVLSLAAFAVAILSKGLTMTLPATLLLLDAYPLRRWRTVAWASLVREKLPYLALSMVAAGLALWAVLSEATWTPYRTHGLDARVAMTAYSFWFYPTKLLWPAGLSPLYPLPEYISLTEPRFLVPVVGVMLLTAVLIVCRKHWPAPLAAWTQSIIAIGPVSGLVHAGPQLANDRFSYLSGLGFALLAGSAVTWVVRHRTRWAVGPAATASAVGLGVVLLLGLGRATWQQTTIWHDSESLWRAALAVDGTCLICHMNLSEALIKRGRPHEAEVHYRRLINVRPSMPQAWDGLGVALVRQGRFDEGEWAYRQALMRSPNNRGALANLGGLYTDQGRYGEALPLLYRALNTPSRPPVLQALAGRALRGRAVELALAGRVDDAITLVKNTALWPITEREVRDMISRALAEEGAPAALIRQVETGRTAGR